MPESYFHVRTARRALKGSGFSGYDIPAVVAGAAGPDILFYHMGGPSLARLGLRLHKERCGPFLTALVRHADGPVARGYVFGFLSHNAADSTLHPWIAATEGSHAALESAVDSLYLLRDKGRRNVLPGDCAVRLCDDKAREIASLLRRCIWEVYGVRVSTRALARCFGDLYRAKVLLREGFSGKRRLAVGLERALRLESGMLSGHLTPGEAMEESAELAALAARAEELSAGMMAAAQGYWDGEIGPLELSRLIGSRSYENGSTV